jgi:hypothetical protein
MSLFNSQNEFLKKKTKLISSSKKPSTHLSHFTEFEEIFNINFIRKEKTYTKLKYSRTPAYDIISGGVAAIFAGFLGFLICEKFGFELLDSADFFFLLMYFIILIFPLRMLLKITQDDEKTNQMFSLIIV